MDKRTILMLLLIFSSSAWAQDIALEPLWSFEILRGVDQVQFLRLNERQTGLVYGISINPIKSMIYEYDLRGMALAEYPASREGSQESGSEVGQMAAVSDINYDGYLDILYASELKASGVNNHRLYRVHRIPEAGLSRLYNRYVWAVKETGEITSIHFIKGEGDDEQSVVTSAIDGVIRIYLPDSTLVINHTIPGSIWDNQPLQYDEDGGFEHLSAAFQGLYLVDDDGGIIWKAKTEGRFKKAFAADIDYDGTYEFFGWDGFSIIAFDSQGKKRWESKVEKVNCMGQVSFFDDTTSYLAVGTDTGIQFYDYDGAIVGDIDMGERVNAITQFQTDRSYVVVGTNKGIRLFFVDDAAYRTSQALDLLIKAEKYFKEGDYNLSMHFANRSQNIYRELRLIVNESYVESIKFKAERLFTAQQLIAQAQEPGGERSYNETLDLLKRAKLIFEKIDDKEGLKRISTMVQRMQDIMDNNAQLISDRNDAERFYALAEEAYVKNAYNESIEYAGRARMYYQRVNDSAGTELASKLSSMAQRAYELDGGPTTTLFSLTTASTTTITLAPLDTRPKEGGSQLKDDDLVMYIALFISLVILGRMIIDRAKKKRPIS